MPTLKLQQLYALFLLLAMMLLAILVIYARISFQHIAQRAQDEADRAARAEISRAVDSLGLRLRTIAEHIATWDETRQHLANPEFYPLWRDVRVRDTGALPTSMRIALYRPNGEILAREPAAALPARIPHKGAAEALLKWDGTQPWLYYRFPVRVHPDADLVLGHGVIRLDPLAEIRNLVHFRYADANSLQLGPSAVQIQRIADLATHLQSRTQPNPILTAALDEVRRLSVYAALLALGLALAFLYTLRQLVVRPIRRLSAEIQALRDDPQAQTAGVAGYSTNLFELQQLQRSFEEYHRRLQQLHQEVQRSSQQFYQQARQDALTGVYNRRAFDEDRARLEKDKRVDECTLILFDCDHFKAINDTYGHPLGDTVIRALATCLTQALRADDRLYRLGGDEFATLMPGAPIETALVVAERCLEQVGQYDFSRHGIAEPVTISIGLAHSSAPFDLTTLHRHADLAMYTAKRPGHPKIAVYEQTLGGLASLVDNREISAVYEAIRQPQMLEFRYQPVMRLTDMVPDYCEALCRIRCDDQVIGPGAIFTIVHNRRLDVELDLAVIQAIDRDLRADLPALRQGVSINLSAPGVVSDKVIEALLRLRADHPMRKIVLEITETALITQMETASANIGRLREAGCLIALDDFGSGYSSLRYLASMPVDLVKFDMSLIRLLEKNDLRERRIVQDIVQIIATAGYGLVAEGIESASLLEQVAALGFSHAQGYYLDGLQSAAGRD